MMITTVLDLIRYMKWSQIQAKLPLYFKPDINYGRYVVNNWGGASKTQLLSNHQSQHMWSYTVYSLITSLVIIHVHTHNFALNMENLINQWVSNDLCHCLKWTEEGLPTSKILGEWLVSQSFHRHSSRKDQALCLLDQEEAQYLRGSSWCMAQNHCKQNALVDALCHMFPLCLRKLCPLQRLQRSCWSNPY